jgi:hypothetical protein
VALVALAPLVSVVTLPPELVLLVVLPYQQHRPY